MKSNKLQELEDKMREGLEKSRVKLLEFKRMKNSPLVISKNGKVIKVKVEHL